MNEYQQFVQQCLEDRKNKHQRPTDVPSLFLEFIGEVGEAANSFKHLQMWNCEKPEEEWRHLREEMGDVLWYFVALCNIMGYDVEALMEENRNKLNERYGTNL